MLESEGKRGFEGGEVVGDEVGSGEGWEFEEEETLDGAVGEPEDIEGVERD